LIYVTARQSEKEINRRMRISFWKMISAGLLLAAVPGFALAHPKAHTSRKDEHASVKHVSEKHVAGRHGTERHATAEHVSGKHRRGWHLLTHHEMAPVEMPAERATQIQTALIKRGYMTGEPTGTWDPQTIAAMQKLQGDNGWQTKITPDSRALIKLGLGPNDVGVGVATSGGTAGAAVDGGSRDIEQAPPQ
jgi:Putative peptidoglycan binding domain